MWYTLGMGKGHSQTLHRNYLLPISNHLEHVGAESIDKLTPVPPADSGLLADGLTESQLESLPVLQTKQLKLVNMELTRPAASDITGDYSQAGQEQPAPLRQSALQ